MRFIIFVIDDRTASGTSDEMAEIDAFNEKLEANGNWIYAAGIGRPTAAKLIDNRNGLGQVVAGSVFNAEDNYTGFWLIKAESREEALALAAEGSKACNRRVELRPFL
ncbi:MAG: YciI family protein [Micrococcales bacterium]